MASEVSETAGGVAKREESPFVATGSKELAAAAVAEQTTGMWAPWWAWGRWGIGGGPAAAMGDGSPLGMAG